MINSYLDKRFTPEELIQLDTLGVFYKSAFPAIPPFPGRAALIKQYADRRSDEFAIKLISLAKKTTKYKDELDLLYIGLGLQEVLK